MRALEEVLDEIKSVRVQGAKEIAVYGLVFLREFAEKQGFNGRFDKAADLLKEVRPTAVVLHNCVEIIQKERKISAINNMIEYLKKSSKKIGRYSDKILRNNMTIMTHCHSGEALGLVKAYHLEHKKKISVIATETRPLEQGVKTAKELARNKIPVTLVIDSAAGFFMNDADAVVVGADALRREGVVNKIGTCLLAFAAKHHKKPFYVVANVLKVDKRRDFTIEERPATEIYRTLSTARTPRGIQIRNPAFDITPWKYVTAVVTDEGIMKPSQLMRRLG